MVSAFHSSLMSDVPMGLLRSLPAEEAKNAQAAEKNLLELVGYVDRVAHALELVDFCEAREQDILRQFEEIRERREVARKNNNPLWLEVGRAEIARNMQIGSHNTWMHIAARDVAITIHDFHRSMAFAVRYAELCPSLRTPANNRAKNAAMKLFTEYFPQAKLIRHAAGHSTDFFGSPKDRDANSVKPPDTIPGLIEGCSFAISGTIAERTVIYTGYGETMTFDLTLKTLERLADVTHAFFKAFTRANSDIGA
jgi:hypothetical protein